MQEESYRESLTVAVSKLVDIRQQVFDLAFDLAMAGELKEWSENVPAGEVHTFSKEIFEGCGDANLKLITALLTNIEITVDGLCNLNNLETN